MKQMKLIETDILVRGRLVYIQSTGSEKNDLQNRRFLREVSVNHMQMYCGHWDVSGPLKYLEVAEVEPEPKPEIDPEPEVASDGSRGRVLTNRAEPNRMGVENGLPIL